MKKIRSFFFAGSFLVAAGIGFLSASFNLNAKKVNAAGEISYVEFDDKGITKLGSYPQHIVTNISADEIRNNGNVKETELGNKFYIYKSKKYAIIDNVVIDTENSNNRYLSNGALVNDYLNQSNIVIEFNEIEWQILKSGKDDTAYLISTNILDREVYNKTSANNLPYVDSYLYQYLNKSFKTIAFETKDYAYLSNSKDGTDKVIIDIASKEEVNLDNYKDANLKQASDFAILNNLTSHIAQNHGVGVPYLNAGYWLKSASGDANRMDVCWAKVAYSTCLYGDPKIGIRPVIQVNYKEKGSGGGGGGTTPTDNPTTSKGGNVPLVLGITFTVLGAGGLITFFILWNKRHPNGKPAPWILASLAGSLVVSVVGISCLAGGIKGGGGSSNCFNYGYYVQTDQYSGGGIVQVGYTAWLIKSDGTCSYCSHLKDSKTASDFSPDNYMSGTFKISGSTITITIPVHDIKNFGPVGGTYKYTIRNCDTIYNASDSFHWVRGE